LWKRYGSELVVQSPARKGRATIFSRASTLVDKLRRAAPKGFAFSDTAFPVFSDGLAPPEIDRFFTIDYRPLPQAEGLLWVEKDAFISVLLRHYPGPAVS
jgi:hypothetical protein